MSIGNLDAAPEIQSPRCRFATYYLARLACCVEPGSGEVGKFANVRVGNDGSAVLQIEEQAPLLGSA